MADMELERRATQIAKKQRTLMETTRHQKAVRALRGLSPLIRTFAIITGENPMGQGITARENLVRNENFAKDLERMHFRYFQIRGSYAGNPEKPFMIFNIGLDDAKYLSHKYDQQAFILATVLDKGEVLFKYFEKKYSAQQMKEKGWGSRIPQKADYQLVDKHKGFILLDSETTSEYSGVFRRFKYRIPFPCFEEFSQFLDSRCLLHEDYKECLNDRIRLGIDGNGARNRRRNRASIYGDNYQMFWGSISQ